MKPLRVCHSYKVDGLDTPFKSRLLHKVEPVYENFKGWKDSLNNCQDFNNLPEETKAFINYIEDYVGVKVTLISNGPNRSDLIHR